ncbi:DNA/RNA non-specific endonuclease [Rodentibacter trehalosifermentans]|uniref:DNA/RNA non-specific endonuclease n=1 Tax=Rodentibacter trehalosifermentans TaxID=1908263 RepID=UPI001F607346|nr:DNA/RNA non-specific endonuclease [Rodentibacter trehalosifermentans]
MDEVKGQLNLDKATRNEYRQKVAGGDCRLESDCGGHLIASMFNGVGEGINLVAMDKTLNGASGRWYKLEGMGTSPEQGAEGRG